MGSDMENWEVKQDLEHRYLVCTVRQAQEDYRVRMLVHLTKAPLLACRTRRVNGELLLTYDVSDRRSLAQLCETECVSASLLQALFGAIKDAYETLQSYLLEPDMLALSPEMIFCETDAHAFAFCCTPAPKTDSFVQLHALSRFLLKVLEREDEKAVRLCYALYRSSLPGQLKQAEVMRLLQEAARGKDDRQKEREPSGGQIEAKEKATAESADARSELPAEAKERETVQSEAAQFGWSTAAKNAAAMAAASIAAEKEKENTYGMLEKEPEAEWKSGTYKNAPVEQRQEEKPRKKHAARTFFRNLFQERRKEQPYFPTPYANAFPSYAGEKLFSYGQKSCVLQGQKKELPTFSPVEYPFLIGSLEFGVDGYIDDVTVSRFHARLEKTDGRYYLTDLDSAHGTKRNGEPLPPQEKTELQNGDEISFGRTRFRFVMQ